MRFLRKTSPRRNQVRRNIAAERLSQISRLADTHVVGSILLWVVFVAISIIILSFRMQKTPYLELISVGVIVGLISLAAGFYIYYYQSRIIRHHARAMALAGLFVLLLATTKLGVLLTSHASWATGTAVTAAIILTIAYDQRFAIGMSIFYCLFASFAAGQVADISPALAGAGTARFNFAGGLTTDINLLLIMNAGVFTCCFSLKMV